VLLTRFGIGPDIDLAAFASTGGVSAPPDPNALSNKIRLDVRVTSSPQLDFQNSYAKLAGTVDLTIRGTVATPSVLGRIQITDGSATFAGTKYQLQRGDIYFTNPVRIDPIIDLDATAQVENYDVTIGLHGTMTNLKPTYRSEPPLSEADVFALLALGRTQEEAQIYQEKQAQAGTDPTTSALLGGALNATVSNRVEKLFGVGSVKIDPAFVGTLGNSAARITVQQQLSKQITATFATNVNSSAEQLIQLQYDLNHNMSIVVTRDESGVFSIVYKLRQRYR
jgi:translocation and assembly module TamB